MKSAVWSNSCGKRVQVKWMVALLLLGGVGLSCSLVYAFSRGPIHCSDGCLVQSPFIDTKTQEFLIANLAIVDGWVPMWMYLTNTTYLVCNATHCTTYTQNFNGEYIGSDRRPISPPPAGGIGSGSGNPGGGGQGGGNGGGGGGGGGGSGSVTVGEPDMVRPPNHEN